MFRSFVFRKSSKRRQHLNYKNRLTFEAGLFFLWGNHRDKMSARER